jgi:hypothetical protein
VWSCFGLCITPLAIVAENVLTDHRREIAVHALTIDLQNKFLGRCVLSGRNFLERVPETILQAHTGRLAIDLDRSLSDLRFRARPSRKPGAERHQLTGWVLLLGCHSQSPAAWLG